MYYKEKHCAGQEAVAMVILSFALCFSLGACAGFVLAGVFSGRS
jgi:hypothetical protein